ncbi:Suppressor of mec-8 and unc-52 1 [Phytophthora citrophthora]|uniref:Suppressor of mec-8 and unc-52 1 n=1 Tax=Phytophthora citrophthora TaxID=4793 RepID=A0AAD9GK49_9STRA|nr:Suppressor of mec-8 and unc-52 1 [Phytophthora citrophthora]
MAAALLQYQACLGIMVRLQVEDLSLLKQDFDRAGRGLSLREFVNVMLDRVSWEPESVVSFIADLVELFAQVDVNGDGTMEWEEFTSAIIEGGMGSSSGGNSDAAGTIAQWRDLQYEEHPRFIDSAVNRPPKRIEYLPEFRRVLLLESSRPVVEILDPSGLFPPESEESGKEIATTTGEKEPSDSHTEDATSSFAFTPTLPVVNKFHPLCYISGYRRDQDEVRSERSPVQALKYLSGLDLLTVSAGDLKLTFWSSTLLTACSTSAMETPRPMAIVHTPRPQRVLEWCANTQQLFSISADLMISVYQVTRSHTANVNTNAKTRGESSDGTCEVRLVASLKKHSDLLQDLLLLNHETLLSCGMDNMIYLWDTHSLQTRAFRQGHRRGVRLMVKLSSQVFMSAGFECEVFGWEISALATTPVFKLSGHNSPVCCIELIPSAAFTSAMKMKPGISSTRMLADQCMTVDEEGWFRWWTLANVLSVESTDAELSSSRRCLQVFRLGSDLSRYPWRAHSLTVLNNGQTLLVAGVHKVKLLRRVRIKPRVLAASAVLYNEASLTIATATDREIRIWDAASGSLLRSYRELVNADITSVDLDARQRKLIVGAQNGELAVVNYLNGAILTRWTPHGQQVSALLYCKEDHTVLTASWDRSLRLYDDDAPKTGGITARNVLLRCITDAHESDIKCLAYCHALSLVVSGSTDGTIKIWDYIYFLLEDTRSPPPPSNGVSFNSSTPGVVNTHSTSEVNVLEFIDPYPLLLSGHESGQVCVWSLTPSKPTILLLCFCPFQMTPVRPILPIETPPTEEELQVPDTLPEADPPVSDTAEIEVDVAPAHSPLTVVKRNSAITCCRTFYDETGGEQLAAGIDRGRFLMFVSSFYGEVMICDISKVIIAAHVRAFKEENMPSRHDRAYNPRRRFLRQGKNARRLRNKHTDSNSVHSELKQLQVYESDVVCTHRWTAHRGNIRCLQIVAEPRGILTCGSDKGVYVWDFQGRQRGGLATGVTPTAQTEATTSTVDSWQWEVDVTGASALKRRQAEEIWDELKGIKLKAVALKQQSIAAANRTRKLSTLRNSASVPVLSQPSRPSSTREMATSVSTSVIEQVPQDEINSEEVIPSEEENGAVVEHTRRLFDQLQGKSTWKKSDLQLARQEAWEKERVKFQQRMKLIMRQKAKKRKEEKQKNGSKGNQQEAGHNHGGVNDSLGKLEVLRASDADPEMLLPELQNPVQELPFADKDNWAVGSMNREKQMYEHFHRENIRRSNKQIAGSSGLLRQRRLENSLAAMDLTPSAFLLEKLGVSCIIHENVHNKEPTRRRKLNNKPPRPKRIPALARAHSLTALPNRPKMKSNQSEPILASSISTSVLPRRTLLTTLCQQYDELLGDDHNDQDNNSPGPDPNPPSPESAHIEEETLVIDSSSSITLIPEKTTEDKQPSPKPVGRRHPKSALTAAERAPKVRQGTPSSSSAGAIRTSAKVRPKKELKSAKKVRIRSDAALMRQERFGPYSRDDIVNVYRTFRKIDQDQSGAITLRELLEGSGLFSGTHMQDNIGSIFSSIDRDQSGLIDLPELCGVVFGEAPPEILEEIFRLCRLLETVERTRRVKKKTLTNDQVQELRQLFKLYDTDDNGDIDAGELFEALRYNERFYESDRRGSTQLTRDDVARIISAFDVNANATLDIEEFIELFREDA